MAKVSTKFENYPKYILINFRIHYWSLRKVIFIFDLQNLTNISI